MKKFLSLMLALILVVSAAALVACGDTNVDDGKSTDTGADTGDVEEKLDVKLGVILLHDEFSTYDLNFMNGVEEAKTALGLSDEVQSSTGIRVDTLFIDEGFGSLDQEALRKAYNTLAGLTEGNRLIGIISHVAELKDRIDKQIVVKKDKSGGSKATVVS